MASAVKDAGQKLGSTLVGPVQLPMGSYLVMLIAPRFPRCPLPGPRFVVPPRERVGNPMGRRRQPGAASSRIAELRARGSV